MAQYGAVEANIRNTAVPPPATVTLTMPLEHARTLRALAGRVLGPNTGRRGHTDDIFHALGAAGVSTIAFRDASGVVTFEVNNGL